MGARFEARRQAIRTPRAAATAGILFAFLLSTSLTLLLVNVPPSGLPPEGLDEQSLRQVTLALNLMPFAGIAFLWFIGVIRDRLGENEDRFFATVFLGSGLLFVAMLFVAGAVAGGLASASVGLEPAVDPTWLYGRFVTRTLIRVYAMRMAAVFMISTTTLSMRFQIVPRWLAILGFVGAGVLLLTVGSLVWVALIFPVWVLILSVNLLVTSLRRSQPAAAAS